PVFAPAEGGGRTFAEMGASAKNAMSHRARALRALLEILRRGESP
ncbi:MAG: non-canonical purine NTP pyrophosphatase, partial [Acidimicrobiaceae bacterium]|nr:non-canonical purine NTP pyrophosphatase [Acidimicrobiaceae bacterium]